MKPGINLDIVGDKLRGIALLCGNLPDKRLTDCTGPEDAAYLGLLLTFARKMAIQALQELGKEIPPTLSDVV